MGTPLASAFVCPGPGAMTNAQRAEKCKWQARASMRAFELPSNPGLTRGRMGMRAFVD